MTKTQKTKNLKLGVLGLLGAWSLGFGVSCAQERGIGVMPAEIEIAGQGEWPSVVPLTVTNVSSETESFEVTFEKDEDTVVSAVPGRFSLDALESARVLVTFEEPKGAAEGFLRVVSTRSSVEGFAMGTGVKVPFQIEVQGDNTRFLAGVGEILRGFGGFHKLFGAAMILATLILLWYVSDIAKPWIFNSGKR